MRLLAPALLLAPPVMAEEQDFSQYGTTNPEEMTLERLVERAQRGDVYMIVCANGYLATKAGRHEQARIIFEACANAGWTQA